MRYAEPYKIKMVEPIRLISRPERESRLKEAGHNLFAVRSRDVFIDLLTDSGTGAMSEEQWASMMRGDESYAGSDSFYRLKETVESITGYPFVIPTHQGRGAEQCLMPNLITRPGMYVLGNMHFDTTRAHIQLAGGRPVDLVIPEAQEITTHHPFKGNIDLERLRGFIEEHGPTQIAAIIMTVTCNSAGGQPVSMANIRAASAIAREFGIPYLFDAARYAENAYFIQQREPGYGEKSPLAIAREMYGYGDGLMMSAKKDALVNIGGLLAFRHEELYQKSAGLVVPFEGFLTYGGLAGRDLEAMATGLMEALDPDYLQSRIGQVEYLGNELKAAGIPIQEPVGGHAVFVDAARFLPHVPAEQFPGHALALELYLAGGIRAVEVGSLMMGRDPETGRQVTSQFEFLRLAIPRRTYTNNHMNVVVDALTEVWQRREQVSGLRFTHEPKVLRHFTARFEWAEVLSTPAR